eukprot:scaffold24458_cov136-Skeletonema_marinoi.AAC.2
MVAKRSVRSGRTVHSRKFYKVVNPEESDRCGMKRQLPLPSCLTGIRKAPSCLTGIRKAANP